LPVTVQVIEAEVTVVGDEGKPDRVNAGRVDALATTTCRLARATVPSGSIVAVTTTVVVPSACAETNPLAVTVATAWFELE